MTCTPQELARAAACLRCLPDGMIRNVRTSLLCQWVNVVVNPCGVPSDCLQITGSTNPVLDGVYFKSSDTYWISHNELNELVDTAGVWKLNRVIFHLNRFTLDAGQPFPCGHWTPDFAHPFDVLGTIVFIECPNNVLMDANGFFWRIIVDNAGNVGTQSDPGPATPDIILDDGTVNYWKLVVDVSGLLGSQPDPGPPSNNFPFIHAPDGVLWEIIVDPAGNVGATS